MLEKLAALTNASHGYLPGNGEILEIAVRRRPGESATAAAGRLLGAFEPYRELVPSNAWYSGSVAATVAEEDRDRYKTVDGFATVPTSAYAPRHDAEFASSLMRIVENVDNAQHVNAVKLRIAIAPRGFYAVHGDGLLAGPRLNVESGHLVSEYRDKKGRVRKTRGDRATTPNKELWT